MHTDGIDKCNFIKSLWKGIPSIARWRIFQVNFCFFSRYFDLQHQFKNIEIYDNKWLQIQKQTVAHLDAKLYFGSNWRFTCLHRNLARSKEQHCSVWMFTPRSLVKRTPATALQKAQSLRNVHVPITTKGLEREHIRKERKTERRVVRNSKETNVFVFYL